VAPAAPCFKKLVGRQELEVKRLQLRIVLHGIERPNSLVSDGPEDGPGKLRTQTHLPHRADLHPVAFTRIRTTAKLM
jgi:hypothetical protein